MVCFSNYGRPNYGLVQLNHYALGAMESYVLKAARGRAVHSEDMLGLDYWVERNWTQEEDSSILALDAAFKAELTALHADAALHDLHERAVHWRHKRFAELMLEEPYRALFGRLLQTPPSRPVPTANARMMISHANKARR